MKIHTILSLALVVSMLGNVPVMAAGVNDSEQTNAQVTSLEQQFDYFERCEQKPEKLSREEVNEWFGDGKSRAASSLSQDRWEPNNTKDTAYPYSKIPTARTTISTKSDLFWLGMKEGNLHDENDVDYYSIDLTAGKRYFIDLRNVGTSNYYIELIHYNSDGTGYMYTTNPSRKPKFEKKPEKYLYITAEDTGKFYIKIANGGDWSTARGTYFFYVGPEYQTYRISNYPIGGFYLSGDYETLSLNFGSAVPKEATIVNMSITDNFTKGNPCSEVDKYMKIFGGKTYYNTSGTGSSTINNISGASLNELWIIGAKCARNRHVTQWSGSLNGSFKCRMAPYPGNEL